MSSWMNSRQAVTFTARVAAVAIFVAGMVLAAAQSSDAAERVNTNKTGCSAIQSALVKNGAAILRYPSKRVGGLVLYDRYVGDSRFCGTNKIGVWASVLAKDKARCTVIACDTFERNEFFPRGPFLKPRLRLRIGD